MSAVSNVRDPFPSDSSGNRVASIANLMQMAGSYLSEHDLKQIREAYRFSDAAHLGQFRATGEPYISHPITVAEYCARLKLDSQAIQAAKGTPRNRRSINVSVAWICCSSRSFLMS